MRIRNTQAIPIKEHPMRELGPSIVAAAFVLSLGMAAAQGDQTLDLAALIECRADAQTWNGLAFSLMDGPAAAEALGWSARSSDNPFLQEYDLPASIGVFGRHADRLALTATGPMAVLDDITPAALAAELGITPIVTSPERFLGEKVIVDKREEEGGTIFVTRISLNVSSVVTHPGLTLAGCSYRLETSETQ
jgi:hypothetical protein